MVHFNLCQNHSSWTILILECLLTQKQLSSDPAFTLSRQSRGNRYFKHALRSSVDLKTMHLFTKCLLITHAHSCLQFLYREAPSRPIHGMQLRFSLLGFLLFQYPAPFHPLVAQKVKNLPTMRVDLGSILVGKIPWRGNGYSLQYPYLENCTDRGAWL